MKSQNQITINKVLTKEKNQDLFTRASMFNSGEEYLDFLIELDRRVNGRDDQINGYKNPEEYSNQFRKKSKKEIEGKIDELLNDVLESLDYVTKCIPECAKLSQDDSETGLVMIPEDDTLFTTKLIIEKIQALRKVINND